MKKLVLILSLLFSISVFAETPAKLALVSPIEIPPGQSVKGLSLNLIYGHTNSVTGIEYGFW